MQALAWYEPQLRFTVTVLSCLVILCSVLVIAATYNTEKSKDNGKLVNSNDESKEWDAAASNAQTGTSKDSPAIIPKEIRSSNEKDLRYYLSNIILYLIPKSRKNDDNRVHNLSGKMVSSLFALLT